MKQPVNSSTTLDQSIWHVLEAESVITLLGSDPQKGLSSEEAKQRLQQYGPNTLQTSRQIPWYRAFMRQFVDVLIVILLVAAAISFAIGEVGDAVTILVIVVLNGVLGFAQEWKAEKAIEALQKMLQPHCKVVREDREQTINTRGLMPGDIVTLEIGDRVPADLRLLEALNLTANVSSLTGEPVAVNKSIEPAAADCRVG